MKIAIPVENDLGMDSQVCSHFGQAPLYAIIDTDTDEVKIIPNNSSHGTGTKLPPMWLKEDVGIDVMLCHGAGSRAISLFTQACIPVFFGGLPTVADMLKAYRNEMLQEASVEDGCSH